MVSRYLNSNLFNACLESKHIHSSQPRNKVATFTYVSILVYRQSPNDCVCDAWRHGGMYKLQITKKLTQISKPLEQFLHNKLHVTCPYVIIVPLIALTASVSISQSYIDPKAWHKKKILFIAALISN